MEHDGASTVEQARPASTEQAKKQGEEQTRKDADETAPASAAGRRKRGGMSAALLQTVVDEAGDDADAVQGAADSGLTRLAEDHAGLEAKERTKKEAKALSRKKAEEAMARKIAQTEQA